MQLKTQYLFLGLIFFVGGYLLAGCAPAVLRQTIPVSSNPIEARVYVNGKPAGVTPTRVDLERTQSYVITLAKESYRQADVVIERRKTNQEQFFKAIDSGITTAMMMKDASSGMVQSMDSYSIRQKTGEAYELCPSAVSVNLEPVGGVAEGRDENVGLPRDGAGQTEKDLHKTPFNPLGLLHLIDIIYK